MRIVISLLSIILLFGCTKSLFQSKWTTEKSPAGFVARFETTKGSFDVEVSRNWSSAAVDRFYQLVKYGFFDKALFYRVVPNFVVQFGSSDSSIVSQWGKFKVADEKVLYSNKKGTISFARAGKETRGTELFINLKDNPKLDTMVYEGIEGFPAFGDVINGMEVVEALYSGYGDNTMTQLDSMYKSRTNFLNSFPKLDSIIKAYIVKPTEQRRL
jgi:cyclophilin family peptidyl-prolyl cis-trans isomerase